MDLPEIAEVTRLTLRPGDRLVVKLDREPNDYEAYELSQRLRAVLGDIPVVILTPGMSLEVASGDGFMDWLASEVRKRGGDPGIFGRKVGFR